MGKVAPVVDNSIADVLDVNSFRSPISAYYGRKFNKSVAGLIAAYDANQDARVTDAKFIHLCAAFEDATTEVLALSHTYSELPSAEAENGYIMLGQIDKKLKARAKLREELGKDFIDGRLAIHLATLNYGKGLGSLATAKKVGCLKLRTNSNLPRI